MTLNKNTETADTESGPLVSVVVPTYNHERYLGECLDSILGQSADFDIDIIVVDDASTDGTPAIIREYESRFPKSIKPLLGKENLFSQGKSRASEVIAMIRGEYVAYCDGDDAWSDMHKLAKQIGFLDKNPDYVLSYHLEVLIDEKGQFVQETLLPEDARRDYTPAELRTLKWGWLMMGTVVHRNVIRTLPPEYDMTPNKDNLIPILLAEYGGAKFQPEVGCLRYRVHPEGMFLSRSWEEKNRMQTQSYLQIMSYFIRVGDYSAAHQFGVRRLVPRLNNVFERMLKENPPKPPGASNTAKP